MCGTRPGSGKTLTSFKTAQLASRLASVDKVLFVVDRKDLDYQTMREYDRFEKGAANSNTSTKVLKKQLEDPSAKIIITTIQKLATFITGNKGHEIYKGHIVLIFDECHRSQFGDMHKAITKSFKKYNIFGFTGTPIFTSNSSGGHPSLRTTPQAFGCFWHGNPMDCPPADHQMAIHTYTIVDAISDNNVLPFRIDYVNTIKLPAAPDDKMVSAIDTEKALLSPERVRQITAYTLEHFDQKTRRAKGYSYSVVANVAEVVKGRNQISETKLSSSVKGFNALFATSSISAAKAYFQAFKEQQAGRTPDQRLKIATIFSYAANEAITDGHLDEEGFETSGLDKSSRDFLDMAIDDYNAMFGTSYDTSSDKFQNYYKDISLRLKNRELDLVIVVNMFLTGFDATTLNTLFVDKRLVNHGLIQAYSRTNRILNSVKTYGNIVSFRDLEQETNDAIALFGNKDARGIILLKPYGGYYEDYARLATTLLETFHREESFVGESAQHEFIKLFSAILKLQNILSSFDEFTGNEIITPRQMQDYQSRYLSLHAELRKQDDADKESITDDLVFEIELIKQVEINVDYILMLVEKWREARGNGSDKEMSALQDIQRSVNSSPTLRNKSDLIIDFVDGVSATGDIDADWRAFIESRRTAELEAIITAENLHADETKTLIDRAFREGALPTLGTAITNVLPPTSRFSSAGTHSEKKHRVVALLAEFFERFFGLSHVDGQ
ncbi:MAG: type I restriction endonuclease subunit R [Marmoricola sp.]